MAKRRRTHQPAARRSAAGAVPLRREVVRHAALGLAAAGPAAVALLQWWLSAR